MNSYEYYTIFYRLLRQGATMTTLLPLTKGNTNAIVGLANAAKSMRQRGVSDALENPFHQRRHLERKVNYRMAVITYRRSWRSHVPAYAA